ncbi:MAG: hypothetical protein CRN43_11520, partial [Candidatus Nephrothrix sp. EaCA]
MGHYSHCSDLELLTAVKNGDDRAFVEICDRYWKPLMEKAIRILHSQFDAEEVVQDLLLRIWNTRDSLNILNVEHYLHTGVRYGCVSAFRLLLKEEKNWEYYKVFLPREADSAETAFIKQETGEVIEKLIAELPSLTQQIFRLKVIDGLTFMEISKQLKCSKKTIEYHLLKSKKILKSELHHL